MKENSGLTAFHKPNIWLFCYSFLLFVFFSFFVVFGRLFGLRWSFPFLLLWPFKFLRSAFMFFSVFIFLPFISYLWFYKTFFWWQWFHFCFVLLSMKINFVERTHRHKDAGSYKHWENVLVIYLVKSMVKYTWRIFIVIWIYRFIFVMTVGSIYFLLLTFSFFFCQKLRGQVAVLLW